MPTIKAHIFPQSTIRAIRQRGPDTKTIEIYSDRAIVARNQNGIYDSNILCNLCDGLIGVADKWFIEKLEFFHAAAKDERPYVFVKTSLDACDAMQFAVSIIYRASLSRLAHFSDISLGTYTAAAAEIATGSNRVDSTQPLVMINVLTSAQLDVRQIVFYPVRCSGRNGPYYVFTISGVQFLVKFGGRHQGISDDDKFSLAYRIRLGEEVVVCCYPFDDTGEADFLRNVKVRNKTR